MRFECPRENREFNRDMALREIIEQEISLPEERWTLKK
jgi:hypothetical protein